MEGLNNNGKNNGIEDALIKNNQILKIVAAVPMILLGLLYAFYFIRTSIYNVQYYGLFSWIYYGWDAVRIPAQFLSGLTSAVGLIGGAVLLITNKKSDMVKMAVYIIAASYILTSVSCLANYIMERQDSYYYDKGLLLFVILNILFAVTWILNTLAMKKDNKINFIVPLIFSGVLFIFNIVVAVIRYYSFMGYIEIILSIAALVVCGLAVRHIDTEYVKEAKPMSNTQQNNYNQNYQQQAAYNQSAPVNPIEPEGFIKIWVLIVLSIVTFGIYTLIWVYKTVGTLNNKLPMSQQYGQAAQLLLCMFVPFYAIYWVYKTCKRIEEYSYRLNSGNSDLSLIGLLLTVFGFALVAYALMQDQINKNIMLEVNGGAQPAQNFQQPYTQPQQQAPQGGFVPQQVESAPQAAPVQPAPQPAPAPAAAESKQKIKVTKEQYESLLRIKELLDMDIISKEEFIQKKNEILNMK